MRCTRCGTLADEQFDFCPKCSKPLKQSKNNILSLGNRAENLQASARNLIRIRLFIAVGAFIALLGVVIAFTNPQRSPMEKEDAKLTTVFKNVDLRPAVKDFCATMAKATVAASNGQFVMRIGQLQKADLLSPSKAQAFVSKNSWLQDPSAKSQLQTVIQSSSTNKVAELIQTNFPTLPKDWVAYQVSNLAVQFADYASTKCNVVRIAYFGELQTLATYDKERDKVKTIAQSQGPAKPQSQPQVTQDTSCSAIATQISNVQYVLNSSSGAVAESDSLSLAAAAWNDEATHFTGSKRDWLIKMSELAAEVNDFVTTGEPSDGPLKATQLQNNMNLIGIFCK